MMYDNEPKLIPYQVYLEEELYNKLELLAQGTRRTKAGVVRWLIQQASINQIVVAESFGMQRQAESSQENQTPE